MAVSGLPPPDGKARAVREMFDRIAPTYDRLNRILTLSLDRRWRARATAAAGIGPGHVVIDVACGTGDFCALARAAGARVVGVDFAMGMLAGARRRGVSALLVRGDATSLPVRDAVADAVTCGFALRNVVAIPAVLAEAARVLRPGGRLVVLEVDEPRNPLLRLGHRLYFHRVVPFVGGLLADRHAYAYLPQSTAYLPPPDGLRALVRGAGFRDVTTHPLGGGAAQMLLAVRGDA